MNPTLAGKSCEVCSAPALWSIRRAVKERLGGASAHSSGPGQYITRGWEGPEHLRCCQHVTSIDTIEAAEAQETLAGKGKRR